MKNQYNNTGSDDFDSPWKEMLTEYFGQFMLFYFPEIHKQIDWGVGYESLDKELHQIIREAQIGGRLADKLFRVWTPEGEETWVLIHVEVQAQQEKNFAHRTFVYNYRISEIHNRKVLSLAVLADEYPNWRPSEYSSDIWGCEIRFRFPIVKILDFAGRTEEPDDSANPFAIVTAVHLKTLETKKDYVSRKQWKLIMAKALYRKGFGKQDVLNLFRFIDWIMYLPEELENSFYREILDFEEEQKMRFIDIAERTGMEKGTFFLIMKQLNKRFGKIPLFLEKGLESSPMEVLEKLGESIFDFRDLKDVEEWWEKNGNTAPAKYAAKEIY